MIDIMEVFYQACGNEFLKSRFAESLYIHGIAFREMHESFKRLGRAIGCCTHEHFRIHLLPYLCPATAYGTYRGYLQIIGTGKILGYLRDYHIGFEDSDAVSDAQFKLSDHADVVDAGTSDFRSFQIHGIEYGHGIDESRSGSLPLYGSECGLRVLIRPFKSYGTSGELRCPSE
ncbi:MAG: hypothetical protein BWY61_01855 [Firmicutes bacterium ADurb.Bin354]|nr:MAG: hypothetical protein BWY61_01855 [Firmicutes bacterium ADurb.Bin354]